MLEQRGLKEDVDLSDEAVLETKDLEGERPRRRTGSAGQEDGEGGLPVRARRNVEVPSGRRPEREVGEERGDRLASGEPGRRGWHCESCVVGEQGDERVDVRSAP